MKTLITTLNSKYIHKSLSLRLLYVATKEYHEVDFKEYTIKEDLDTIANDIIEQKNGPTISYCNWRTGSKL